MAEFGLRVVMNVGFNLFPVSTVITYFFTGYVNRQHTTEALNLTDLTDNCPFAVSRFSFASFSSALSRSLFIAQFLGPAKICRIFQPDA